MGEPSPRSVRVVLVSLRFIMVVVLSLVFWFVDLDISLYASFCERAASLVPMMLCSREVMKMVFWELFFWAPSAASQSAISFPVIPL